MRYAFIDAHRELHPVRVLCKMLSVHPSGFYAWVKEPLSHRAQEDQRQAKLIEKAWKDSGKIYGYRKIDDDLIDMGEAVSENRVARLARLAGIQAHIGYKKKPGGYGGKPSVVVDNTLDRQFSVDAPDRAWVTDITYLRTHEGFAYLCIRHCHLDQWRDMAHASTCSQGVSSAGLSSPAKHQNSLYRPFSWRSGAESRGPAF